MKLWPGKHYPLGATFDGAGTNFSVFSEVTDRTTLMVLLKALLLDKAMYELGYELEHRPGWCTGRESCLRLSPS